MKADTIWIDGIQWAIRPDTLDEYVIKEARSYFKKIDLEETDVWLDAGANVGAFAVRAAQVALGVIAVEPAPDNLQLLNQNVYELNSLDNVNVVPMALVGASKMKSVELFLNAGKNPGAHSLYVQRGRVGVRVLAVDVNKIIRKYGVNKIKMDIEGGEVDVLFGMNEDSWRPIRQIILEYHFSALKDRNHEIYQRTLELLEDHSFKVVGLDPKEGMKNWHTTVVATR